MQHHSSFVVHSSGTSFMFEEDHRGYGETDRLSHTQLSAAIGAARLRTQQQYGGVSGLRDRLHMVYAEGLNHCTGGHYSPQEILSSLLHQERQVICQWNDFRLLGVRPVGGGPDPITDVPGFHTQVLTELARSGLDSHQLPHEDTIMLYDGQDDIPDDEQFFPLRTTVRHLGIYIDELEPLMCLRPSNLTAEQFSTYIQETYVAYRANAYFEAADNASTKTEADVPTKPATSALEPAPSSFNREAMCAASTVSGRTKQPRTRESYDKLRDAPSRNLPFPIGNLTAAEVLAFFPEWLKSWQVIDRFLSNRPTNNKPSSTIVHIINTFRVMPSGNTYSNAILHMMKGAVRQHPDPRFKNFKATKHPALPNHNPGSVSVTGFRTPAEDYPYRAASGAANLNTPPRPIPFKDLAKGVKTFPAGNDTLDLVRCVEYHMQHPDQQWLFPNDFDRMVREVFGGPAEVRPEHHDKAIFDRWAENITLTAVHAPSGYNSSVTKTPSAKRRRDQHEHASGAKRQRIELVQSEPMISASVPAAPSKTSTFATAADDKLLEGAQHAGGSGSQYTNVDTAAMDENMQRHLNQFLNGNREGTAYADHSNQYQQTTPTAQSSPYPSQSTEPAVQPGESDFQTDLAIDGEGIPLLISPTQNPEYYLAGHQLLKTIAMPLEDSTSDWAENVRWQHRVAGPSSLWTVSPANMEQITHIRQATGWVSAEKRNATAGMAAEDGYGHHLGAR